MAKIHYARVDEFWRKEEKYAYLDEKQHLGKVEWQELSPDEKHNWVTEGLRDEFADFTPIGTRESKASPGQGGASLFHMYGRGVATCRDAWTYNFDREQLGEAVQTTISAYNDQVSKWNRLPVAMRDVDRFVSNDETRISWSEGLKNSLRRGIPIEYCEERIRYSTYRPFVSEYLYFDSMMNERRYQMPVSLPTVGSEVENKLICVPGPGGRTDFWCFCTNLIANLSLISIDACQCFPFYTYNEDGTNRRENITDWALEQFRTNYNDKAITKWDIFHYVYAVLHHPVYRERYAANLKRELPRIPFLGTPPLGPQASRLPVALGTAAVESIVAQTSVCDSSADDSLARGDHRLKSVPHQSDRPSGVFQAFADAGQRLAELHVNYENQPEYPLERIEALGMPLDWRVERMKLSKDKRSLIYNDFLTLGGIPENVFEYRLGNRSALDWIIDQYQVSTDKRSGITNDPNRADDPEYIVRLIGQVIHVSLETMKIVRALPKFEISSEE